MESASSGSSVSRRRASCSSSSRARHRSASARTPRPWPTASRRTSTHASTCGRSRTSRARVGARSTATGGSPNDCGVRGECTVNDDTFRCADNIMSIALEEAKLGAIGDSGDVEGRIEAVREAANDILLDLCEGRRRLSRGGGQGAPGGRDVRPHGLPRAADRSLGGEARRHPHEGLRAGVGSDRCIPNSCGPEDNAGVCARTALEDIAGLYRRGLPSRRIILTHRPAHGTIDADANGRRVRAALRGRSWRPAPRRPGSVLASIPSRAWCRAAWGAAGTHRRPTATSGPSRRPSTCARAPRPGASGSARSGRPLRAAVWGALVDPEPGDLPAAYGVDRLVLVPRDPWWLFAFWEIAPATREVARGALGADADEARPMLRVYDVTFVDRRGSNASLSFDVELPRRRRVLARERRPARRIVLRRDRPPVASGHSAARALERGHHPARHPVSGPRGALARVRPDGTRLVSGPARRAPGDGRAAERRPARPGTLTPRMAHGTIALVLHAHLPFVRHPAHEDFLEERWLFEAITETYLPLLEVLDGLDRDRVPVASHALAQPDAARACSRTRCSGALPPPPRPPRRAGREGGAPHASRRRASTGCAEMYLAPFLPRAQPRSSTSGSRISSPPSAPTRSAASIESSPPPRPTGSCRCSARSPRHRARPDRGGGGRAPALLRPRRPTGSGCPECAYRARPRRRSSRAPASATSSSTPTASRTPRRGPSTACTRRSSATPASPPSAATPTARSRYGAPSEGYPGDFGIATSIATSASTSTTSTSAPYLPPTGQRIHTGIKYHRITGKTDAKEPYDPDRARERRRRPRRALRRARASRAGGVAGARDGPAARHRLSLRRRALRPLVVRGAAVARARAPPARRDAGRRARDARRRPRPPPGGTARRRPPPRAGAGRGTTRSGSPSRTTGSIRHLHATAERLHALCRRYPSADERTRRALTPGRCASCCSPRRATGRS